MVQRMLFTLLIFVIGIAACFGSQQDADYMATNLRIEYKVLDNLGGPGFEAQISVTNVGDRDFVSREWFMFIPSIRLLNDIRPNGTEFGAGLGLWINHVNGDVNRVHPTSEFAGFLVDTRVDITYRGGAWVAARTDVMPNWYVTVGGSEPRVIESTRGESLDFVGAFTSPNQWKRDQADQYDPYTPEVRLELSGTRDLGEAPLPILPQPVETDLIERRTTIADGWVITTGDQTLQRNAQYLADKLGIPISNSDDVTNNVIRLSIGAVIDLSGNAIRTAEAYTTNITADAPRVDIIGTDTAGVFYGVQTLLAMTNPRKEVSHEGIVADYPRYHYRGMHMDVARNYHGKEDVLRHLEVMATYKMNKFYYHLTDDEGWRLEIPGLPELTEVGSNRCHDETGDRCITPQLGSGPTLPNAGSGYLTVSDYREILQYAADRHITVIPEFDMPGHCHSSINAMLSRYRRYRDTNLTKAEEFLLSDVDDTSEYVSVQYYTDNAVNPCMESSYNFVTHVMDAIVDMHKNIQELEIFNFGGDEVPGGAWLGSPVCQQLMEEENITTSQELKEHFVKRVAHLAHQRDLDLAGWEDGLMDGDLPYDRDGIPNSNAYGYIWDNVWEWGHGQRAYLLANAGFKVVLSHATHLYFDFPYEPDPEDRGYYWATRATDVKKTFGYMPMNVYNNMDIMDRMGNPINKEQVCRDYGCAPLDQDKESNVIGIQGQVWCETVRTSEQLDYMVFPRLLAVAERAWHEAGWEKIEDEQERDVARQEDWEKFANNLGYKELARLDQQGVHYQMHPPGARIANAELMALSNYPGLLIEMSADGGITWAPYSPGETVNPGETVYLRTLSADGRRFSRHSNLTNPAGNGGSTYHNILKTLNVFSILFVVIMI